MVTRSGHDNHHVTHPRHGIERTDQHVEEGEGGEYFGGGERGGGVKEAVSEEGEQRDHHRSRSPKENAQSIQVLHA